MAVNQTENRTANRTAGTSAASNSTSAVAQTPAAEPAAALAHFQALLAFETDCWDVHHAMTETENQAGNQVADFVLLDVRGPGGFDAGHVDGAINIPHPELTEENLAAYPTDTLFVVYCAGPHCNGADKAAVRLAMLGRPVKKMIGGATGWLDEGFSLVT